MTEPTHYVLVDFENIRPTDLGLLKGGPFKVKVFLGPKQSRIPVAIASAMQSLGDSAEYILIEKSGSNALDFHIAYYIGVFSSSDSSAFFHVISKDTGFDSLLSYLRNHKIQAQRSTCIADMPYFKPILAASPDDQVAAVVADLIRRKKARPRTQKTLINTLHTLFKRQLSEEQLTALLNTLCERGLIKVVAGKVTYLV